MTTTLIHRRIARGIELKQIIADAESELKEIKHDLITEAQSRDEEQKPTEGGGWSWEHDDGTGKIARVTQPAAKLKSKVDPESALFGKLRALAGSSWSLLFAQVPAYKPVDGFRDKAVAHLGRDAKKFIRLMSGESAPQVAFEVAETKEKE